MNTLSVKCFLSVAHTLNFSDSATELGITQQAVSRNIAKLEELLGVILFSRNYQSVHLTPAGQKYYALFSEFERDLILSSALTLQGHKSAVLRISWCDWTGCPPFLLDAIREFQRLYPEVEIPMLQTSAQNLLSALLSLNTDVVICSRYLSRGAGSSYITPFLLDELPLYLVSSRNHPLFSDVIPPQVLNHIPCLTTYAFESTPESVIARTRNEYASISFSPRNIQVLPDLSAVQADVAWGNGITLSPGYEYPDDLFIKTPTSRTVSLCALRLQRNTNPYAVKFGEFLMRKKGARLP